MVSSLTVAVLTGALALSRGIRVVKVGKADGASVNVVSATDSEDFDATLADVAVVSATDNEDFDATLAEVAEDIVDAQDSTHDEELQLTHEEEMQLVSDQTKFRGYINEYRKSLGLNGVCYNSALNAAAKKYAQLLWKANLSARHEGPDGSCHNSRAVAEGYCYSKVGECGGGGRISISHMFIGWQNSPLHDKVMKDPAYKEMGLWCNPRPADPKYRCFLTMGLHYNKRRCCVENGCSQKKQKCCGSGSIDPNRQCTECCSTRNKFRTCG